MRLSRDLMAKHKAPFGKIDGVAGFYESDVTFIFHFDENVTVAARVESAKRIRALDLRGKQLPCCSALLAIVAAAILESISLPSAPHGVFVNCSRRPRS
jgi:hypothetical protein